MVWYSLLILAVGAERIAEMVVSTRNARWSFARGGAEYGRGHFGPMVVLHVALLLGCLTELWLLHPPFVPELGWPMLALVAASQGLRWWCIAVLGHQWNTRVIVVPGAQPVRRGPYHWMQHPNYVAVVVEGFALPLVHTAWITALAFTVLNAVLLGAFRIPCENRALAHLADGGVPAETGVPGGTGGAARMGMPDGGARAGGTGRTDDAGVPGRWRGTAETSVAPEAATGASGASGAVSGSGSGSGSGLRT